MRMSSSLRVGGEKSAPVRRGAGAGMACRQRKSARPTENPQCGFADFGRFNLWRPIVVERTRGSKRVQAQPAGSKRVQALPAGSKWVQAWPADSGSRQGRPKIRSADSQTSAASIYGGRQSSKEPAAASGCRLSLPAASGSGHCPVRKAASRTLPFTETSGCGRPCAPGRARRGSCRACGSAAGRSPRSRERCTRARCTGRARRPSSTAAGCRTAGRTR